MKKIIFTILILITFGSSQHIIDCVGNSITANGYPEIVDFWMEADEYEWDVYNYGIPGITVSISGFDYINTQSYQEVMSRKSEHIVVMLGSNDRSVVANYGTVDWEADYRLLINNFRSVSQRVFLGTITYQIYSGQNSVIDDMNGIIRQVAQDYGLTVIDFNSALGTDPDNFMADGVHPITDGKYKLARLAFDILKTYSTPPPPPPPEIIIDMELIAAYNETQQGIDLDWTDVPGTGFYRLNKAWSEDGVQRLWLIEFHDDRHTYRDLEIESNKTYFYGVQAFDNTTHESPTIMITTPIYLGIDDEYWQAVEDYDNQKPFLFNGCSMKRMK